MMIDVRLNLLNLFESNRLHAEKKEIIFFSNRFFFVLQIIIVPNLHEDNYKINYDVI